MWVIRASFAIHDPATVGQRIPPRQEVELPSADQWLEFAERCGQDIWAKAIVADDAIDWFTVGISNDQWEIRPIGIGLHDGLAGVGLFFAYLSSLVRQGPWRERALGVGRSLVMRAASDDPSSVPMGMDGAGGVVFSLSHMAIALGEPSFGDSAWAVAQRYHSAVFGRRTDVTAGAAGWLLGLASLAVVSGRPELFQMAEEVADHLISESLRVNGGLGWPDPPGEAPLTGMAHGASGCALALAVGGVLTGQQRFVDAARAAIAYEDGAFDAAAQNWPDFRRQATGRDIGGGRFITAWCHGASGIGMARVRLAQLLEDPIRLSFHQGQGGLFCHCSASRAERP